MASKKELRKAMNARLHGLTAEEKAAASAAVCARLAALPELTTDIAFRFLLFEKL